MSNQSEAVHNEPALINIRKLAALDMVFHSPKLILAEFGFGVIFPAALGALFAKAGFFAGQFNLWESLLGCYLLFLALNYVPLLLYAISIIKRRSAHQEVALELADKDRSARKYALQSFLLLLPLVMPILAISQERRKRVGK